MKLFTSELVVIVNIYTFLYLRFRASQVYNI